MSEDEVILAAVEENSRQSLRDLELALSTPHIVRHINIDGIIFRHYLLKKQI